MEARVKVNVKNVSLYHSLCCVNSKIIFYQLSLLMLAYVVRSPKIDIFMVDIGLELKKYHKSVCEEIGQPKPPVFIYVEIVNIL